MKIVIKEQKDAEQEKLSVLVFKVCLPTSKVFMWEERVREAKNRKKV